MEKSIIIAGYGGQGVLFFGTTLAQAAMMEGKYTTWIPSYGAEMRGGHANCSVKISDMEIASPIIDYADIGVFLNTVVSFLITMFAVFLMVRVMNKLRAKKAVTTRTCPYCKSTINIQATKCPNCCSKLQAEQIIPAQPSDLEKGIKTVTRVARDKITKITKVAHGGRKSR